MAEAISKRSAASEIACLAIRRMRSAESVRGLLGDAIALSGSRASFVSRDDRTLLRRNGLAEINDVFAGATAVDYRHDGRGIWSTEVSGGGNGFDRVYVKMHWGRRRLVPRMGDLLCGHGWESMPAREWSGLAKFESLGLNVPRRLAMFDEGWLDFRAAVVLSAVPAPHSLDELFGNGIWSGLRRFEQQAMLDTVFRTASRIYAAGLEWKGISSRHFYPERDESNGWKVWLIDCEGVRPLLRRSQVERGYRKLWRSMAESGADSRTLASAERRIELELSRGTCTGGARVGAVAAVGVGG